MLAPIKNNFVFFVCMLLLGSLCTVCVLWNGSRMAGLVELWLDLYCLCALLMLIPAGARGTVRGIISVVLYAIAIIDLGLYYTLGYPIIPQILLLTLQTNPSEAAEAFRTYADTRLLLTPWILIFCIIGLHIWAGRHIRRLPDRLFSSKAEKLISVILVCTLAGALSFNWVDKKYKFRRLVMQQTELELQESEDLDPRSRFYLPVYRLADAWCEVRRQKQIYESLKGHISDFKPDSCSHISPEIVLIIGESNNRHHSQLYGYDKPTTPHQAEWMERGQLVTFADVVSPWNTTCESLENMLSLAYYGGQQKWYQQPFITSVMRNCGYEVSLISNQYVLDKSASFSDFIEDIFINIPEVSSRQFDHRNISLHTYDSDLVTDYDSIASQFSSTYRFTIFHTRNVHFEFAERYPPSFQRFNGNNYERSDLNEEQKEILAAYDNALLYNDHVVNEILLRFSGRDAIVIYVPDHGERIFDGDTRYGRSLGFSEGEVRQQHQIPMWFWASKEYLDKRPEMWQRIRQASSERYMTDLLPFTIMTLAGIHSAAYCPQYDILSSEYDSTRPRIIRETADYDTIVNGRQPR